VKLIEQAWQGYSAQVLPCDATPKQILDCRRAFFGGAAVLWTIIQKGLSNDHEATAEDMAFLAQVAEEIEEYGERLDADFLQLPPHPSAH
jgi:hypothetical protein